MLTTARKAYNALHVAIVIVTWIGLASSVAVGGVIAVLDNHPELLGAPAATAHDIAPVAVGAPLSAPLSLMMVCAAVGILGMLAGGLRISTTDRKSRKAHQ